MALFAAPAAYYYVTTSRRQRRIETKEKFDRDVRAPEDIATLRELYGLCGANITELKEHRHIEQFGRVLDRLESFGEMLRKGSMDRDVCMDLASPLVLRVWYVLGYYADDRNGPGDRGRYARNVRFLVEKTLEHQVTHEPRSTWPKLSPPGQQRDAIDLVPRLLGRGILTRREFASARRCRRVRALWNSKLRMPHEEWTKLESAVTNKAK